LVNAAGFWYVTFRAIAIPYQLDYGEGIVLYQASKIDDLAVAYKSLAEYPFVVFHYPPLYHVAVRLVALLVGDPVSSGRLVSVVSGLLIEVTLGLLVFFSLPRRVGLAPRLVAAVFAGLSPNLLQVMRWTRLARVDMLALLLSFV